MNYELTDEQELIRQTVREFALARVAPVAEELDREERFPYEIVAELAELGLMGIPIPEQYGGAGADTVSYAIAIEELTRIDSSVAITVAAHTSLGTMPIYLFGNDAQKEEWLPQLASGEKLAAFGLTEPDAGSDAGATRTRAELQRRRARRNGSKIFITNAGTDITACVTITALTGDGEVSNVIVPNGTPGYEISAPMHKLGWHASDTRELSFKDCRVPAGNLLGERGKGFQQFMTILDGGRISVASMGVGLAQGAYDLAFAYAQERQQFGKPISKFQAIQFQLADMATEIEAGRQLVYRAAWLKDQGKPFALAAAQAKLYTGLLSNRAVELRLADPRRLRLHGRVRHLAALPRPEDPRDRRRHERGAAHGHRAPPRALAPQTGTIPAVLLAHAVWTAPPAVFAAIGLACLLFGQGWLRLRRRGRPDLASWSRVALFGAGIFVVLMGLISPIDTIGENHLLWVHMLQHVLIGDAAIVLDGHGGARAAARVHAPAAHPRADRARSRRACGSLVSVAPARRLRALGAEPRGVAHPEAVHRRAAPSVRARPRARVLDARGAARLDAAHRSRLAQAAHDGRPHRARGCDVRGRPGAHRRARVLVPPALSALSRRVRLLGAHRPAARRCRDDGRSSWSCSGRSRSSLLRPRLRHARLATA